MRGCQCFGIDHAHNRVAVSKRIVIEHYDRSIGRGLIALEPDNVFAECELFGIEKPFVEHSRCL